MGVAQFFEEELAGESVVANFATTVVDGKYIGLINYKLGSKKS